MNQEQQREYWRIKQQESRARRRPQPTLQPLAPIVIQPRQSTSRIEANVNCKLTVEQIAALPPIQRDAFMLGVSKVIGVLREQHST